MKTRVSSLKTSGLMKKINNKYNIHIFQEYNTLMLHVQQSEES